MDHCKGDQSRFDTWRAGARIGLIDYGQSKQLPDAERLAFAALLLELSRERRAVRPAVVAARLADLGLRFERTDNQALMTKMAFGMFDTRTSHRCAGRHTSPRLPLATCSWRHSV